MRSEVAPDAVQELVVLLVAALVEEEPRDSSVVLLRHRTHAPRSHDVHEAGTLEHLQVVPDGSLRHLEKPAQLTRRGRALAQQCDDAAAHLIAERPELSGLGDHERVRGFVVEGEWSNGPLFPTIRQ